MDLTAVTERILTTLAENFDLAELTPRTSFAEIELDSLALLEISVLIERNYQARISETELFEAGSVAGVVDLLEQRLSTQIR